MENYCIPASSGNSNIQLWEGDTSIFSSYQDQEDAIAGGAVVMCKLRHPLCSPQENQICPFGGSARCYLEFTSTKLIP